VAETKRLLNARRLKRLTAGSNPALSATLISGLDLDQDKCRKTQTKDFNHLRNRLFEDMTQNLGISRKLALSWLLTGIEVTGATESLKILPEPEIKVKVVELFRSPGSRQKNLLNMVTFGKLILR
jgi:hypothetical protein